MEWHLENTCAHTHTHHMEWHLPKHIHTHKHMHQEPQFLLQRTSLSNKSMLLWILFISTWNNSFKPKIWHKSNGSVAYILGSASSLQTCLFHEVKSHNDVNSLFWLDETFWDELFWEYSCRIKVPPAPRIRVWSGKGWGDGGGLRLYKCWNWFMIIFQVHLS